MSLHGDFEWRLRGEGDDDWRGVRACEACFAAERAAQAYDEAGRLRRDLICNGRSREFEIRSPDGTITRWSVWGEAWPSYYAHKLPFEPTADGVTHDGAPAL